MVSFTKSFLSSAGLLCTAGFESPAEALYLKKKLCVIPMHNQYEQICNAAFLKSMGVRVLRQLHNSEYDIADWITNAPVIEREYPDITRKILERIINDHTR